MPWSNSLLGNRLSRFFLLSNLCNDKKLFFCFSEKTCPPCIDAVVDIMNEVFTDEEIKTKIVFVSPDYPARLRNDCYGKKLLSLHNKNLGLPMELEDSFAPFLFIMDKDLCVKYLHIHNKPLPRLTLIYLEEIKKCGRSYCGWSYDIKPQAVNEDGKEDWSSSEALRKRKEWSKKESCWNWRMCQRISGFRIASL